MASEIIHVGTGLPDAASVVHHAGEVATLLTGILRKENLIANISGKDHVMVEGWTLLASMMNHSVGTTGTIATTIEGNAGFWSHAEVYDPNGNVVGSADGVCTRGEKSWAKRDDYALSGMAQTRAISRALRQRFGFVIKLAGYETTPAEEMVDDVPAKISHDQLNRVLKAVTENHVPVDRARAAIQEVAGVDSSVNIPREKYEDVMRAIVMLEQEFAAEVVEGDAGD